MQYFIMGATGYIGSYLFQAFQKDGAFVIGTSRKYSDKDNMVFYDIEKDTINNIRTDTYEDKKIAIVCIGETNIDKCYTDYEKAYNINVIKTQKLIQELSDKNFRIIYFSSDCVFDGRKGGYTEESQTNALNKYGMMKVELEHYLLDEIPDACILRIPKIVSALREKQNILEMWMDSIKNRVVTCIKGNRMSFLYMDDIYHVCRIVAEQELHGLYNIAGDSAYSRAELARKFYNKLGILENITIQEWDLEQFSFKDIRPLNISMSNQKFKRETGYQFTDMDTVIESYINHLP